MLPLFLQLPEKGPRPKWTICKHVSDNSKKCLSVGNFWILSAARLQPTPAYVEAWNIYQKDVILS